jgi:hypothetical protein
MNLDGVRAGWRSRRSGARAPQRAFPRHQLSFGFGALAVFRGRALMMVMSFRIVAVSTTIDFGLVDERLVE